MVVKYSEPRRIDLSKLAFEHRRSRDQKLSVKRLHESMLDAEKILDFGDPFLKDLYRITTTRKFRKLGHTIQVMLGGGGLFRSRLTHVIDSSVIAQRIAVNNFNITGGYSLSLIQASAMTHDLGQSPLGYGGDKALKTKLGEYGVDFNDKNTAIKVLTEWSNQGISFRGLNPTVGLLRQMIMGLDSYNPRKKGKGFFYHDPDELSDFIRSLDRIYKLELDCWGDIEGRIAVYGDAFSWMSEDIYSGLNEGVFTLKEITDDVPIVKKIYKNLIEDIKDKHFDEELRTIKDNFDRRLSSRFKRFTKMLAQLLQREMMSDLVDETERRYQKHRSKIKYADDIRRFDPPIVSTSDYLFTQWESLWKFAGKYHYPRLLQANGSFENIVGRIFDHLMDNPQYMPRHYVKVAEKAHNKKQRAEVIAEYMNREMTDRDIISEIRRIDPSLFRIILRNKVAKDFKALNDLAV